MVYVAITRKHSYTFDNFFGWVPDCRELISFVYYDNIPTRIGSLRDDPVIFTDLDRLSPKQRAAAKAFADRLLVSGRTVLNHPATFVDRCSLLNRLHAAGINRFRAFKVTEILCRRNVRYPIFLRLNSGHHGNITSLAASRWQLTGHVLRQFVKAALGRVALADVIAVEYQSVRQQDGCSAKYSYLKVGPSLIARHVLFSKNWVVKYPDLHSQRTLEEEAAFIASRPYMSQIRSIFTLAGVDYGRIDFSVDPDDGSIQVWEINTNPTLASSRDATVEDRRSLQLIVLKQIHEAFLAISSAKDA